MGIVKRNRLHDNKVDPDLVDDYHLLPSFSPRSQTTANAGAVSIGSTDDILWSLIPFFKTERRQPPKREYLEVIEQKPWSETLTGQILIGGAKLFLTALGYSGLYAVKGAMAVGRTKTFKKIARGAGWVLGGFTVGSVILGVASFEAPETASATYHTVMQTYDGILTQARAESDARRAHEIIAASHQSDVDAVRRSLVSSSVSDRSSDDDIKELFGGTLSDVQLQDLGQTIILFAFDEWHAHQQQISNDQWAKETVNSNVAAYAQDGLRVIQSFAEKHGVKAAYVNWMGSNSARIASGLPELQNFTMPQLQNAAALAIYYSYAPEGSDLNMKAVFDRLEEQYRKRSAAEPGYDSDVTAVALMTLHSIHEKRAAYAAALARLGTDKERRDFARSEAVNVLADAIRRVDVSPEIAERHIGSMSNLVGAASFSYESMNAIDIASKASGWGHPLLVAILAEESGLVADRMSPTGCVGLFQFCETTWSFILSYSETHYVDEVALFKELASKEDITQLDRAFALTQEIRRVKNKDKKGNASALERELQDIRSNANINAFMGALYAKYNSEVIPHILAQLGADPAIYDRDDVRFAVLANVIGAGTVGGSDSHNRKHEGAGLANWLAAGMHVRAEAVLPMDPTIHSNHGLLADKDLATVLKHLNRYLISPQEVNAIIAKYGSGHSLRSEISDFVGSATSLLVNKAQAATSQAPVPSYRHVRSSMVPTVNLIGADTPSLRINRTLKSSTVLTRPLRHPSSEELARVKPKAIAGNVHCVLDGRDLGTLVKPAKSFDADMRLCRAGKYASRNAPVLRG